MGHFNRSLAVIDSLGSAHGLELWLELCKIYGWGGQNWLICFLDSETWRDIWMGDFAWIMKIEI